MSPPLNINHNFRMRVASTQPFRQIFMVAPPKVINRKRKFDDDLPDHLKLRRISEDGGAAPVLASNTMPPARPLVQKSMEETAQAAKKLASAAKASKGPVETAVTEVKVVLTQKRLDRLCKLTGWTGENAHELCLLLERLCRLWGFGDFALFTKRQQGQMMFEVKLRSEYTALGARVTELETALRESSTGDAQGSNNNDELSSQLKGAKHNLKVWSDKYLTFVTLSKRGTGYLEVPSEADERQRRLGLLPSWTDFKSAETAAKEAAKAEKGPGAGSKRKRGSSDESEESDRSKKAKVETSKPRRKIATARRSNSAESEGPAKRPTRQQQRRMKPLARKEEPATVWTQPEAVQTVPDAVQTQPEAVETEPEAVLPPGKTVESLFPFAAYPEIKTVKVVDARDGFELQAYRRDDGGVIDDIPPEVEQAFLWRKVEQLAGLTVGSLDKFAIFDKPNGSDSKTFKLVKRLVSRHQEWRKTSSMSAISW